MYALKGGDTLKSVFKLFINIEERDRDTDALINDVELDFGSSVEFENKSDAVSFAERVDLLLAGLAYGDYVIMNNPAKTKFDAGIVDV